MWRGKRREEHSEEGNDWRRRRGLMSLRGTGYREVRKMKERQLRRVEQSESLDKLPVDGPKD